MSNIPIQTEIYKEQNLYRIIWHLCNLPLLNLKKSKSERIRIIFQNFRMGLIIFTALYQQLFISYSGLRRLMRRTVESLLRLIQTQQPQLKHHKIPIYQQISPLHLTLLF